MIMKYTVHGTTYEFSESNIFRSIPSNFRKIKIGIHMIPKFKFRNPPENFDSESISL